VPASKIKEREHPLNPNVSGEKRSIDRRPLIAG
jgi:hypothetical protein